MSIKKLIFTGFVLISLTALSLAEEEFDRLDGKGESGKKVDFIEWEGNLEIHIYPKGSLKGLALKLDDHDANKTVMVVGYRFDNAPKKQIIRRQIIGIPFAKTFRAFLDPKEPDFDKIVISNNGLSLTALNLDPEPTRLYPEDPDKEKSRVANRANSMTQRIPAAVKESDTTGNSTIHDDGSITPYRW